MTARYNTESVKINAKVRRWAKDQLCIDDVSVSDVLEHSIRDYGPATIEWLNEAEGKPRHVYDDFWKEQRDIVSDYTLPHKGLVLNETENVNIYEESYEELTSLMEDLGYGVGKNPRKKLLSAILLKHRNEIADDVESGDIEPAEVGGE